MPKVSSGSFTFGFLLGGAVGILLLVCFWVRAEAVFHQSFAEGFEEGSRRCCKAACEADGDLGVYEDGGCYCINRRDAAKRGLAP